MSSSQSHFPCMNCFFYVFKCPELCFAIFSQFMKGFLFSFWPKPYARDTLCAPSTTWDGIFIVGKAASDPSSSLIVPPVSSKHSWNHSRPGPLGSKGRGRVKNANSTGTNEPTKRVAPVKKSLRWSGEGTLCKRLARQVGSRHKASSAKRPQLLGGW